MVKVLYDIASGVPGVRLATKADEGEIFGLLLLLHAENGLFSLNRDKVMAGIQWATERRGGVIFVIEEDRRIVASLGMTIAQDWYSDDEYLLERWNYVHPHCRHRDYARRLIEQGKWSCEWFKSKGLTMPFQCGINSFDRTEAKIRLYARYMPCIGAYFMYGYAPLQKDKVDEAMREIKDHNKELRKDNKYRKTALISAVPTVESILRISRREQGHV